MSLAKDVHYKKYFIEIDDDVLTTQLNKPIGGQKS